MKIEEVIGQRVQTLRQALPKENGKEVTQVEFGKRLGTYLGKPWSRQAVWMAEKGERSFTAVELVAISKVLHTSVARLFIVPDDVDGVELPSGVKLQSEDFTDFSQSNRMPFHLQERVLELLDQVKNANAELFAAKRAANRGIEALDGGFETVAGVLEYIVGTGDKTQGGT